MNRPQSNQPLCCSRRHLMQSGGMSLAGVALAWLLNEQKLLAAPAQPELEPVAYDLEPKTPPLVPRAKAMISLWMIGGPSHVDLFDPKPALKKLDGQPFPGEIKYDNAAQASSKVLASPWKFQPHGESGTELSELLPHLAEVVDDIAVIRSMKTGVNNHGQSMYALNTGRIQPGRPSLGSWLTFGLGAETHELPAFVALTHPDGPPLLHGHNWTNGWLPSLFQGTMLRPKEPRLLNLDPPKHLAGAPQEQQLEFLRRLNSEHLSEHPAELDLAARIASYELAARMQSAAKEALDISRESEATIKMYGIDEPTTADYGARCLIARRMVERGVRFVQILNSGQSWDHHGALVTALPESCRRTDKPCAALIKDLKSRGLLESTLVHWGGEMGRLPVVQNDTGPDKVGRDHNTYGFSMWLAGGGVRGGVAFGETDEFGHHAVKDVVMHTDYLATVLHLFGLDHRRLIYRRNGQELSLTDSQPARIVTELLA